MLIDDVDPRYALAMYHPLKLENQAAFTYFNCYLTVSGFT